MVGEGMSSAIKQALCSGCNQPATWTTRVFGDIIIPGGRLGYEYCRLFYLEDDRYFIRPHEQDNVWGCDSCKRFGIIDRRTPEQRYEDARAFERQIIEFDLRGFLSPRVCEGRAITLKDLETKDHD
jgi:hypothetical protein